MKTAEEIIAIIRDFRDNYAAQDNVHAARTAQVLERLLDEVTQPSLDDLRDKFLN